MSIPQGTQIVIANKIIQLSRFDPKSEVQIKELVRERVLAGWHVSEARAKWPEMQRTGDKVNRQIFDFSSSILRRTYTGSGQSINPLSIL